MCFEKSFSEQYVLLFLF